ncbi:nuclear transport factor 2 family protein [Acidicapsa acidisoli]|uniref:nuclear transport factor 2 family protein n=1 Tax=Acidicapsa acidisoli TaxID=1615681 RepID=UPI0021E0A153|nr:nuclear transport factor 2 family protein [Acidicapsa acidisoli]
MRRTNLVVSAVIVIVVLMSMATGLHAAGVIDQGNLKEVREAVWRAWFADDVPTLKRLVPADAIVISAGEKEWKHQAAIFEAAAKFHADGGKLVRLAFPHTEEQRYGNVAILYTTYEVETEMKGKRSVNSGRATEVFVMKDGKWMNSGWHTDAEK